MGTDDSRSSALALGSIGVALGETGRAIDAWSRLLTGVALLACALPPPAGAIWFVILTAALAAGFGQLYFALRLTFDRPIFAAWIDREDADPDRTGDLAAFDAALAATGLRPAAPSTRPLAERVRGTRHLLRMQTTLFIVQIIAALAGALVLLAH